MYTVVFVVVQSYMHIQAEYNSMYIHTDHIEIKIKECCFCTMSMYIHKYVIHIEFVGNS